MGRMSTRAHGHRLHSADCCFVHMIHTGDGDISIASTIDVYDCSAEKNRERERERSYIGLVKVNRKKKRLRDWVHIKNTIFLRT